MELSEYLAQISGANTEAQAQAQAECTNLLKIPGSMGRLEDIAVKLAGITGKAKNDMPKKAIIIMSSDNGVVVEGVSSATQDVTVTLTECFTRKVTGVGAVSRVLGNDLIVYDVGIAGDIRDEAVINKKIAYGTKNMAEGPAMSREECIQAVMVGIEAAKNAKELGYDVIGTGEMGIGNTSTSSCIVSVLTGVPVEDTVGAGTGMVDEEARTRKAQVLARALEVNKPDAGDVIDVISKVGGFDIAALTGLYIGCAIERIPVVVDGYISSAAALCAFRLNPLTYDFMIESHASEEVGYKAIVEAMNLKPMFFMNMRLGEGSGCPFTFFAIDAANSMMNTMFTFDQGMINSDYVEKTSQLKF